MKKMIRLVVLVVCLINIHSIFVFAEDKEEMIFDKRQSYNIYFHSFDDSYSAVIEDVQIIRFQEIANKTFLVIKAKGLKLTEEEGFILFDSISAILPERNFRVKEVYSTIHLKK